MKRILMAMVTVAALSSCGADSPELVGTPSPAPSLGPQRTEAGVPGPLPARAESSDDVNHEIQFGHDIFITDEGFAPKILNSVVGAEVWFTNETDEEQRVEFVNFDWESGAIEPGGHASFTPEEGLTFAYRLVGDESKTGSIEVSPYYETGETAAPAE